MEPAIKTGSLIFILPSKKYGEGDIITYKSEKDRDVKTPDITTTHRIIEIETEEEYVYKTKGDANKSADISLVSEDLVLGKVVFSVPYFGHLIDFTKTQTGFILLIVIPATILVYGEILNIRKEAIKILKNRKKKGDRKDKN
jgi:signal peptidase I